MARFRVSTTLAFLLAGCSGLVTTKTFFDRSSDLPPFFPEISTSHYEEAYELLCPPIRSATDYDAFVMAMNAHPFLHSNGGFSTSKSHGLLGAGVTTYTGWLASMHGTIPAEMIVNANSAPCVLGVTVLGASILPPLGSSASQAR